MAKLMDGKPTANIKKSGKKVTGQKGLGYENEKAGGMSKGAGTKSDQTTKAKITKLKGA